MSARNSPYPTPANSVQLSGPCSLRLVLIYQWFTEVYYRSENPCVDGSIPPPGTTPKASSVRHLRRFCRFSDSPEIPSKYPCCAQNCAREKLTVSNSSQLEPRWRGNGGESEEELSVGTKQHNPDQCASWSPRARKVSLGI